MAAEVDLNYHESFIIPDALARKPPVLDDIEGIYDWQRQRRDYGDISPVAYKVSTQTFSSTGQPKDSDKDYDR